ncbi:MAG: cytochrome c3 family protein [Ignavibacteria bacterium]|nr:cytochrome c3 family protein [Ignavibacteria bacterium]
MIYRYLLLALSLAVGVVLMTLRQPKEASGLSPVSAGDEPRPGVKFSHQFHAEAGLVCTDCHMGATTSMQSADVLWADHNACMSCHEEPLGNECGYCHLDPANIQEVTPAERTLLFPHALHQELECQVCHSGMEERVDFSMASLPGMETCYTCHNNEVATNTCETCHIDFVTLIPLDHQHSDFRRNHRETTRLGGVEQSCQTCHVETFCQECHQGVELKAFGERDLMADPRPKISVRDNADQMMLQSTHELNYRFFHAIDARSQKAECESCHEPQSFCAECHVGGGNINQARFKPASHAVPGFTTFGAGSGGGLHAEAARRDIESCVSCHDVEGQDPTCLVCHAETGRVR